MRSKQTIFRHNGYEMRSHAETRWAAIMDALNIRWLYEPRTINTRHGWYLPDFYLPACGVYIEVKGPSPDAIEVQKAADVEVVTGCQVIFAHGDPVMLWGELLHGLLSYYAPGGTVDLSTAEVGALVQEHYDLTTYYRYMVAGDRKPRPDVVHASEVIAEIFNGWLDRDGVEQAKRTLHMPLNETKLQLVAQASRAEWFIAEFSRAIQSRKHKEAA